MSKSKQQLTEAAMTRHHIVKEMRGYLDELKLDLSGVPVIHVAGTKGKGSTCAFVESILRHHGYHTGLFTSPHLIHINERVRIDGRPCEGKRFCSAFWSVWDCLKNSKNFNGKMPRYFQFLTLVAFSVFFDPKRPVDVIILETGVGGRLDATNVFAKPVVTGITKIGYDHMKVLGNTLTQIATEKAGIMKKDVPVITCSTQDEEAFKALQKAAKEKGVLHSKLDVQKPLGEVMKLGLEGDHQRENAAVAMALAHSFLERTACNPPPTPPPDQKSQGIQGFPRFSPEKLRESLKATTWPGRCQTLPLRRGGKLCIDGAHTSDSCARVGEWFSKQVIKEREKRGNKSVETRLIFTCSLGRDPVVLMKEIFTRLAAINALPTLVLSCPFDWDKFTLKACNPLPNLLKTHNLPRPPNPPPTLSKEIEVKTTKQEGPIKGCKPTKGDWQITLLQVWHALSLHSSKSTGTMTRVQISYFNITHI
ncbi:hypothetical protein AAMO2058_001546900 [Amorphochlora amoebiformis]